MHVVHGPLEVLATGVASSTIKGSIAFDVFTCAEQKRLQDSENHKMAKHCDAVEAAGD